jgi:hypothetical protein
VPAAFRLRSPGSLPRTRRPALRQTCGRFLSRSAHRSTNGSTPPNKMWRRSKRVPATSSPIVRMRSWPGGTERHCSTTGRSRSTADRSSCEAGSVARLVNWWSPTRSGWHRTRVAECGEVPSGIGLRPCAVRWVSRRQTRLRAPARRRTGPHLPVAEPVRSASARPLATHDGRRRALLALRCLSQQG